MKYIQFFPDGLKVSQRPPQFYEAAIYSLMTVVGIAALARVGLRLNRTFEMVILAMNAIALVTMLFTLFRVRTAFKRSAEAVAAGDKAAVHALWGMMYSFRWGNAMYLLIGIAVLLLYASSHS